MLGRETDSEYVHDGENLNCSGLIHTGRKAVKTNLCDYIQTVE